MSAASPLEEVVSDAEFAAEIQAMIDEAPASRKTLTIPKEGAKPPVAAEAVHAPDYDRQDRVQYSHDGMIQLMIDNPGWGHAKLAKHFGHTPGWFANVLAGDEFQMRLDLRRHEVLDPTLTATMEERFRGLTLQALTVMQKLLDNPKVQDATVLKAAEIGIKALGLGMKKDEEEKPKEVHSLDTLADRLVGLMKGKAPGQGLIGQREVLDLNTVQAVRKSGASDELLQELREVPDA